MNVSELLEDLRVLCEGDDLGKILGALERFVDKNGIRDHYRAGDMLSELSSLDQAISTLKKGKAPMPTGDKQLVLNVLDRFDRDLDVQYQGRSKRGLAVKKRALKQLRDSVEALEAAAAPRDYLIKFNSVEVTSGKHKGVVGQIMWLSQSGYVGDRGLKLGLKVPGAEKLVYVQADEVEVTDKARKKNEEWLQAYSARQRRTDSRRGDFTGDWDDDPRNAGHYRNVRKSDRYRDRGGRGGTWWRV